MSTLNDLYASATVKSFMVQSNSFTGLITKQLDGSKYIAVPVRLIDIGYVGDISFVILDGTQAIWNKI